MVSTSRSVKFQVMFEKIVVELGFEDSAMTVNGQAPMAPSDLIMVIDFGTTRTHLLSMRGPFVIRLRGTGLVSTAAPGSLSSRLACILRETVCQTLLGPYPSSPSFHLLDLLPVLLKLLDQLTLLLLPLLSHLEAIEIF